MLFDEDRVTEAAQSQRQRCAAFGEATAGKIRAARKSQFSLLPHDELARLASSWYDASAQAMLSGNYAPIDSWTRMQAQTAAAQNFELDDLLEVLRVCRGAAIEGEKWSEDIFSVVDDAINEALRAIDSEVSWTVPPALNYLSCDRGRSSPAAAPRTVQQAFAGAAVLEEPDAEPAELWSGNWLDDRRDFGRNCLKLPIRVRATTGSLDELTYTRNVSRSGLYFLTRNTSYKLDMMLKVTYPYWTEADAINREYRAKVLRLDRVSDGSFGVAIGFVDSLGPRGRA